MKIIYILFLYTLISCTIYFSQASVNDFCVADLKSATHPTGYPCKPVSNLTSTDFALRGLVLGNTSNPSKTALTPAFVTNFPALNGLGISAARLDIGEGGSVPMHTHPGATELVIVTQGQITTGFLTPNTVYSQKLNPGDLFVFPQGMLHFLENSGKGIATAFLTFSSENPGAQLLDLLLFSNNLSSEVVTRTTFLDPDQVKKLKTRFGGSG